MFTPTVEHCSMATLIGLCIRTKLLRSLPPRFKVDIQVSQPQPGAPGPTALVQYWGVTNEAVCWVEMDGCGASVNQLMFGSCFVGTVPGGSPM